MLNYFPYAVFPKNEHDEYFLLEKSINNVFSIVKRSILSALSRVYFIHKSIAGHASNFIHEVDNKIKGGIFLSPKFGRNKYAFKVKNTWGPEIT